MSTNTGDRQVVDDLSLGLEDEMRDVLGGHESFEDYSRCIYEISCSASPLYPPNHLFSEGMLNSEVFMQRLLGVVDDVNHPHNVAFVTYFAHKEYYLDFFAKIKNAKVLRLLLQSKFCLTVVNWDDLPDLAFSDPECVAVLHRDVEDKLKRGIAEPQVSDRLNQAGPVSVGTADVIEKVTAAFETE